MDFMEHSLIALAITIVCSFAGQPWLGLGISAGIFAGREVTQAEYRWIEKFGEGRRINMPWYGGFSPAAWDLHSVGDLAFLY
jgi:hypothetical protein